MFMRPPENDDILGSDAIFDVRKEILWRVKGGLVLVLSKEWLQNFLEVWKCQFYIINGSNVPNA